MIVERTLISETRRRQTGGLVVMRFWREVHLIRPPRDLFEFPEGMFFDRELRSWVILEQDPVLELVR